MPLPHLVHQDVRSLLGLTAGRDRTLHLPYLRQPRFDLESGSFTNCDGEPEKWCPMDIPQLNGGLEAAPAATRVDGAIAFDMIVSKSDVLAQDGAARRAVDDEQLSSTRSSS